jgi:hypothetical protein
MFSLGFIACPCDFPPPLGCLKRAPLCALTPKSFTHWCKSHIHLVVGVEQNVKAHWSFPNCVKSTACISAPQFWEFNSREMDAKVYYFVSHVWSPSNKGAVNFVTISQIYDSMQNFTNFPSLELTSKWIQKMWTRLNENKFQKSSPPFKLMVKWVTKEDNKQHIHTCLKRPKNTTHTHRLPHTATL